MREISLVKFFAHSHIKFTFNTVFSSFFSNLLCHLFPAKCLMVFVPLLMLQTFLWNHLPTTTHSVHTYLSFREHLTYFINQAFPARTIYPFLI